MATWMLTNCSSNDVFRLESGRRYVLGRNPRAAVDEGRLCVASDSSISRTHASLLVDADSVAVEDHKSTYGTYVGDEAIRTSGNSSQEDRLHDKAVIKACDIPDGIRIRFGLHSSIFRLEKIHECLAKEGDSSVELFSPPAASPAKRRKTTNPAQTASSSGLSDFERSKEVNAVAESDQCQVRNGEDVRELGNEVQKRPGSPITCASEKLKRARIDSSSNLRSNEVSLGVDSSSIGPFSNTDKTSNNAASKMKPVSVPLASSTAKFKGTGFISKSKKTADELTLDKSRVDSVDLGRSFCKTQVKPLVMKRIGKNEAISTDNALPNVKVFRKQAVGDPGDASFDDSGIRVASISRRSTLQLCPSLSVRQVNNLSGSDISKWCNSKVEEVEEEDEFSIFTSTVGKSQAKSQIKSQVKSQAKGLLRVKVPEEDDFFSFVEARRRFGRNK